MPNQLSVSIIAPLLECTSFPLALETLGKQRNADWELVLVGTAEQIEKLSLNPGERVRLLTVESTQLAGLVNAAIADVAGESILILTRDAAFVPDAVEKVAWAFSDDSVNVAYSDHAIPRGKVRSARHLPKPDFSPERLRGQFYIGESVFLRTTCVRALGGLQEGLPGAELYDLVLRAVRAGGEVPHIPGALIVFQNGALPGVIQGSEALAATRKTLERHLAETGGGVVDEVRESGVHRTRRLVKDEPLISIVIPTRGSGGEVHGQDRCFVVEAVRSVVEKSTYGNYEFVVVMDTVADPHVAEDLVQIAGDRMKIVWWDKPFNFSEKMNFGVFHSRGEFVLFLNDDIDLISPSWMESLLALCQLPGAGMVGAMLYFEDDTVQHAGHSYDGGDAGHIGMYLDRGDPGPFGALELEREVLGVTAACALMPRDVFDEVGGFSLLLPVNFNDVDLCMKVNFLGYQIYWTPNAELYHYESKTRVSGIREYEVDTAWGRWGWKLDDIRYWPYGDLTGWHPDRVRVRRKERTQ